MAASYVAVGTAMYMITVSRCPAKKNPAANDPPPPRRVLSERHLRLAQACGMLRFSGRSSVEGGGFLHCDLATQEALRRLGERAFYPRLPGLLEQGPDPGRAAAPRKTRDAPSDPLTRYKTTACHLCPLHQVDGSERVGGGHVRVHMSTRSKHRNPFTDTIGISFGQFLWPIALPSER